MTYEPIDEESHLWGVRNQSVASYRDLLAQRDTQLAEARKTKGPASDRWQRLDKDRRDADEGCRAIQSKLQRPTDGRRVSIWWFVLAAGLLAALEAPINKFMLDNIMRGNNFDSYVVSLFVTFALLYLAHIAGHLTRQIHSAYEEKIFISNIVIALAIVAFLALCVGVLTIGRAFFTVAGPAASGLNIFMEVGKQVRSIGPLGAFLAALSDNSALFLACLNSAGIAIAFLTAYITHDSDRSYQSALDKQVSSDRKLSRMERKYNRLIEKIGRRYTPRLSIVAATHAAQTARLVALKHSRGIPLAPEDQFDLTSLDSVLAEVRTEISKRARVAAAVMKQVEEPSSVAPLVVRERR